jgi:hypothetical protein
MVDRPHAESFAAIAIAGATLRRRRSLTSLREIVGVAQLNAGSLRAGA